MSVVGVVTSLGEIARSVTATALARPRRPACPAAFVTASDAAVVKALQTDAAATDLYALLVARHHDRVRRLVLAVLGPAHLAEAEDVAQEAFLTAYRQLPALRVRERFATWLYSIAYRRAIDFRRQPWFQRTAAMDQALAERAGSPPAASPYTLASDSERRLVVETLVRGLPDPYPCVLRLHYWMECSVDEVAALLAMRPGTVKSYLHRARQRLGEKLLARGIDHA